jgi:CheY-like chemotaxis protein
MPTVLVVEDVEDIREMVAEPLRDAGYDVLEAEHGKQALALLDTMKGRPCLVLLDLMMPVMSGSELLRTLKDTHRLAAIPVVVVSAGGEPAQAPQATRFVRKPPSDSLLLQLVGEFCGPPARD